MNRVNWVGILGFGCGAAMMLAISSHLSPRKRFIASIAAWAFLVALIVVAVYG